MIYPHNADGLCCVDDRSVGGIGDIDDILRSVLIQWIMCVDGYVHGDPNENLMLIPAMCSTPPLWSSPANGNDNAIVNCCHQQATG